MQIVAQTMEVPISVAIARSMHQAQAVAQRGPDSGQAGREVGGAEGWERRGEGYSSDDSEEASRGECRSEAAALCCIDERSAFARR